MKMRFSYREAKAPGGVTECRGFAAPRTAAADKGSFVLRCSFRADIGADKPGCFGGLHLTG